MWSQVGRESGKNLGGKGAGEIVRINCMNFSIKNLENLQMQLLCDCQNKMNIKGKEK